MLTYRMRELVADIDLMDSANAERVISVAGRLNRGLTISLLKL